MGDHTSESPPLGGGKGGTCASTCCIWARNGQAGEKLETGWSETPNGQADLSDGAISTACLS